MTESPEIPAAPALSPRFDKARRLSKILVIALTACLVLGVVALMAFTAYILSPDFQAFVTEHLRKVPVPHRHRYFFTMAAAVPYGLALIFARKLFARFAAGEVFTPATIGIMRTAALWLTVSGCIPFQPLTLIAGIATYVAAYVMEEACRIADDSASIV